MNNRFGQLEQAFYRVFVSNTGSVKTSGSITELAPEQVGIFKVVTNAGDHPVAVSTVGESDTFFLAAGTYPSPAQESPYTTATPDYNYSKTKNFNLKQIVGWRGVKAKKGSTTKVVALGYNGLDASAKMSLNAKLDNSPLVVKMVLRGEPIRRHYGNYEVIRTYQIDKGLCTASCDCFDPCGKVPAGLVADKLIEAINRDKWMGVSISKFVKATKLEKCETNTCTAPTLTEFKKYKVSLCDDGSSSLALLGAAYPTRKIKLLSRENPISTYEMDFIPTADGVPANFTVAAGSVIPNCGTCPAGYTYVAAAKHLIVKTIANAALPTITGQISATLLDAGLNKDTYSVLVATTRTDAQIIAQLTGDVEYEFLGTKSDICTNATTQTYTWVATGEVCNKTTKDYVITVGDSVCGTSRLADLQKAYPSLVIAEEADGDCARVFKTTVTSDCIAPEFCNGIENYTFTPPLPFEGKKWSEYTGATLLTPDCDIATPTPCKSCCVAGVMLETAVFQHGYRDCTFGWFNWRPQDNYQFVDVEVAIQHFDYTGSLCDETPSYMTVLRETSVEKGTSGELVQEMERASLAYQNKYWNANPFVNDAFGFKIVAKPELVYDSYFLTVKKDREPSGTYILKDQNYITYAWYVPAGSGAALEALINPIAVKAGLNPVVL